MHITHLGPQRLTWFGENILRSRGIYFRSLVAEKQKIPRAEDVVANLPHYFGTAIDPEGAHEIDDAFTVEETATGFSLWVHIANPTAFFEIDSPIDLQARELTASTYGGDIYLPMLPAHLVEQATLTQGSLRPAITVHLNFDQQGTLLSTEIVESAFTNKLALSYQEADRLLESPKENNDIIASLKAANKLTALLHRRLLARIKDPTQYTGDNGSGLGYLEKQYKSYLMVSQLMIATNNAVAQYLRLKGPSLYRCHQLVVSPDKTPYLAPIHSFLRNGGGNYRAYYSPVNTGHEGLGLDCYVHFTSPLRRYADLLIHYILKKMLCDRDFELPREAEERLAAVAEHCTVHPYEIQQAVGELLNRDLLLPVPEIVKQLSILPTVEFSKELTITLLAGNADISSIIAAASKRALQPEDILLLLRFMRDHESICFLLFDFFDQERNFDYVKTLESLAADKKWPLSTNGEKFDVMIDNDFYTTSSNASPASRQQAAFLFLKTFILEELEQYNPVEAFRFKIKASDQHYQWLKPRRIATTARATLALSLSTGEELKFQGEASKEIYGTNGKTLIAAKRFAAEAAIAALKARNLWDI